MIGGDDLPTEPRLSGLVANGLGRAHMRFGLDGEPHEADKLAEAGRRLYDDRADGAAVGIVMTNDRATVECLLGAILTGVTLVSLPLPPRGNDVDDYGALVDRAVAAHGLADIVIRDDIARRVPPVSARWRGHAELTVRPLAAGTAAGFRLVQYSSGTTADPKPILLDDRALGVNVAAILERLAPRPGDAVASWLPLSHDMGLIGMTLASLAGMGPAGADGGEIVLLEPEQFMHHPSRWLAAIERYGVTITACPDFGLRWTLQRHRDRAPADLSTLRCVIVGGEVVRAETLAAFSESFAPHGLPSDVLCPAYGLAELGLAATMTPPGEPWRRLDVEPAALADGQVRSAASASLRLVASGPPLAGYTVRSTAGPGRVGPVAVQGGSIGADAVTAASLASPDGWLATGDVGFTDGDGWLYVTGRDDDRVVAHGRNLYAPALDAAAGDVASVRSGRAVVVGLPTGELVVAVEAVRPGQLGATGRERLRAEVRRRVSQAGGVQPDRVVLAPKGGIPLTASGKPRRGDVVRALVAGELCDVDAHTLPSKEATPRRDHHSL